MQVHARTLLALGELELAAAALTEAAEMAEGGAPSGSAAAPDARDRRDDDDARLAETYRHAALAKDKGDRAFRRRYAQLEPPPSIG